MHAFEAGPLDELVRSHLKRLRRELALHVMGKES